MFTTDSRAEKFLDNIGVKYDYSNDVEFCDLAGGWKQTNLGRSQARIAGAIEEYGLLMDQGSAAPAPILWYNDKKGHYEVLDGMQRLMAEELRKPKFFNAYIVRTESLAMVQKIRVFANHRLQGGYQESGEWTLAQAISVLIDTDSMSVEEVAEFGGWTPSAVRAKKEILNFGLAIRSTGGPEKLPDSLVAVVAQHAQRSDFVIAPIPICQFFRDIVATKMSVADAEPHIEQFFSVARSKRNLHEQFKASATDFREDEDIADRLRDPSHRRRAPRTPEGRLHATLSAALTTAEKIVRDGDRITGLDEYFQIVVQLKTALTKIQKTSRKRRTAACR